MSVDKMISKNKRVKLCAQSWTCVFTS